MCKQFAAFLIAALACGILNAPELSPTLGRLARSAEAAGITRLTVMDHLWQIGGIGPPASVSHGRRLG